MHHVSVNRNHGHKAVDTTSYQMAKSMPLNNGTILKVSKVIKAVMSSAAEAELGALFMNAKTAAPMRKTLEELGHPQPLTPME
eukprot:scaffold96784_cov43-Cyclotella_meneghiniana.AAC.2